MEGGMGRKKQLNPDFNNDRFLAFDGDDRRFAKIHLGMLTSSAWKSLSATAKIYYITSACHAQSPENAKALVAYTNENSNADGIQTGRGYFILADDYVPVYGIKKGNTPKYLKELEEAGFIECIHRNQHRHRGNVYRLSERWKKGDKKDGRW